MSVIPTALVCALLDPAVPSLLFYAIFVLLFTYIIRKGIELLNSQYGPYEMFSESHAPEIQTLTNKSAQFKIEIVNYGYGLKCK